MTSPPRAPRREKAEALRTRLLEGLLALDQAAFSPADLDGRLEVLLDKILETLRLTAGAIRLSDGNGRMALRFHRGLSPWFLNQLSQRQLVGDHPDISGILTPIVIPDIFQNPRFAHSLFREEGIRSLIMMPIRIGELLVGSFAAMSFSEERPLGEADCPFLEEAAKRLGQAILSARYHEEAQRCNAELAALQKIAGSLGSYPDEKRAAEVIVETVEDLLGTHHVSLLTRVPGTERFRLQAIRGKATPADLPDAGDVSLSDEVGMIAWAVRTGQPFLANDVRREPRYWEVFPGILSEVVVPIFSQGAVIGVINVESERLEAFDHHTLRLLTIVANQAQVILENARLFSQAKQKISDLTTLHEIGLEITSTLGVEQILERIVDIVVGSLKPFDCAFYSLTEGEPRELTIGPSYHHLEGKPVRQDSEVHKLPLDGPGVIAWVTREGHPLLVSDVREDPRYVKVFEEVVSEIAVPLTSKSRVLGVLNVESNQAGAFSQTTLEFLTTIAQQASVAVENARLYERLEQSYFDTVRTLVLAMDAKDPYTRGHSERVRRYSVELARVMGMSEEDVKRVSYAGLLHDIGKIGVREDLLLKPGELTPDEFEEVKLHSVLGEKLVQQVGLLRGVGPLIRSEHENYGGGGYPDGLAGEAIPLGARIIAVADAYDAMTTDRAYHHEMPIKAALDELRKCAGKQFDPRIVEALAQLMSEEKESPPKPNC